MRATYSNKPLLFFIVPKDLESGSDLASQSCQGLPLGWIPAAGQGCSHPTVYRATGFPPRGSLMRGTENTVLVSSLLGLGMATGLCPWNDPRTGENETCNKNLWSSCFTLWCIWKDSCLPPGLASNYLNLYHYLSVLIMIISVLVTICCCQETPWSRQFTKDNTCAS